MRPFVLDASTTLSWFFRDEADAHGDAVLARLAASRAVVPAVWPLEIANALRTGERRRRNTEAESAAFLTLLDALPIQVDAHTALRATREVLTLARAHGLSVHDATYLELAGREGLPLASRDAQLAQAARAMGLEVIGG